MADRGEDLDLLRRLLTEQRVLSLALVIGERPHVGLVPFVVEPSYSAALVHVSQLSAHGKAMADDVPFSVLVHGPDAATEDPLQLPRVTLDGTVEVLPRGGDAHRVASELYVSRFPASRPTFALGDFRLCRLKFSSGRLVAGFARARGISGATLRELGTAGSPAPRPTGR